MQGRKWKVATESLEEVVLVAIIRIDARCDCLIVSCWLTVFA